VEVEVEEEGATEEVEVEGATEKVEEEENGARI